MLKLFKDITAGDIITKGYLARLILSALCIFVIGTALSAVFIYLDINRPLDLHYSAVLATVTEIKETLIIRTLKINAIFYSMISAGLVLLGIIYTHRIAGPLYRIKMYAKSVSEGRLDINLKFRKKDAVHLFAEALNLMTQGYHDRLKTLDSEIRQLKAAAKELQTLIENDKDTAAVQQRITELNAKINTLLGTIKL